MAAAAPGALRGAPLLLALCATGCFGSCPSSGPPAPDACSTGSHAGITTVEVGPLADPFTPYAPDAVAQTVSGGQGLSMLPLRYRLTGPAVPECLAQETLILDGNGIEVAQDGNALRTYADGAGRTTQGEYVILGGSFRPGDPLFISVSAGATARLRLFNEVVGALDAGLPD